MTDDLATAETRSIVVEEVFPHSPQVIWRALTDGNLIARFLMLPTNFAPMVGTRFTFQTKPAGAWDGTIHCEVLEVVDCQRFSFSWKGGDDRNVGYGSRLDTVVTWSLSPTAGGTRLRLVHSGFELPRNETAYANMSGGWTKVVPGIAPLLHEIGEPDKIKE
ncbi:SRPBCC family protein [Rhizobium oryzicola]|uniref:SRPBCC domain-containing protein n=1 Tax=Rhizobium oryzicola TaxID=1232668 RepID=A0ABT8SVM7_9HYPH|nr:SRPBCC domain-containing protein [Rhizobium oryzicola]MDO1582108.1 SRPBCC domain-containing protein [Rhizobium oryzicola]